MKNVLVDGVWIPFEEATAEQVRDHIAALNQAETLIRMEF